MGGLMMKFFFFSEVAPEKEEGNTRGVVTAPPQT